MVFKSRHGARDRSFQLRLAASTMLLAVLVALWLSRSADVAVQAAVWSAQQRLRFNADQGAAARPLLPLSVPPGCLHLQRVCVDQQQVIMMDPAHSPQEEERPLPQFDSRVRYNFPHTATANPDVWVGFSELPPVVFRPASAAEPTPDLQQPQFEKHAIPLLLAPNWPYNYAHVLGNAGTFLHSMLHGPNATLPAERVALVALTPFGMALPGFYQQLLQPLAPNYPIQSFADFSRRPSPSAQPSSWRSRLLGMRDGSASMSRPRCYEEMLACAGPRRNDARNISSTARFIAQTYSAALPPDPVTYSSSSPDCSKGHRPNSAHGSRQARSSVCLRVLFLTRSPKPVMRQILNIEELLEKCRRWKFTDNRSGVRFLAACASYQPAADLPTNIAAVRSADIVTGIHGAGLANAFFMRHGGAMLEIFNGGWPWQLHREWADREKEPALQWWGLTVEDPAALEPGELEATLLPHPRLYKRVFGDEKRQRDRNIRVPWRGLQNALQEIASVRAAGGMAAYLQRRAAGLKPVHWYVQAGGKLKPGGLGEYGGPFVKASGV